MICVPVIAGTNEEAVRKIPLAARVADLIELRIDYIPEPDLPRLLANRPRPVIVTCRVKKDGGRFEHGPGGEAEEYRIGLLIRALNLGADYVDVEFDAPAGSVQKILNAAPSPERVILSYHDFGATPDDLRSLKNKMTAAAPGSVLKIAVFARSIEDCRKPLDLLKNKGKGERLLAFCMGEYGEISRILAPIFGGEFTFGSLTPGEESAPGQVPASILQDLYRVHRLGPDVEIYGLIGNPVRESAGYLIHNRAFIHRGMNRIYLPCLVTDVKSFIEKFKDFFRGWSVTMPFKQDILPLLDAVDPIAAGIGAVNTVHVRRGRLIGYNTDSSGAVQALEEKTPLPGKKILMIGAGGVARAVGFGAAQRGAKIVFLDTGSSRTRPLAKELGAGIRSMQEDIPYDILINCSPVGMHPKVEETPFPREFLRPGRVVFDTVYNPLETRLIREASQAGCRTIRGLDLFINQAMGQFELWTGEKAPKAVMVRAAMERLAE